MTTRVMRAYCNNLDGDNERQRQHTTISLNEGHAGTKAQRHEVDNSGGWRWRSVAWCVGSLGVEV